MSRVLPSAPQSRVLPPPAGTAARRALPSLRRVLPLGVTAALLVVVLDRFGIERIAAELAALPLLALVAATVLLTANQLLGCARFHGVLVALDVHPTMFASLRANIFSIVGGMLFFSYFGQSLARAALMRRLRVTTSVAFAATAIERLISVSVLLAIALLGALLLSGHVSIDMHDGGNRLAAIAIAGLVCLASVLRFGLGERQRDLLVARLTFFSRRATWSATRWTLAMHATMLLAYAVLALEVEPSLGMVDALAVSSLVMLAASLPVSFAGWGIRELSAAAAFQAIGASPEAGITLGVGIGLLSIVGLLVNVLLVSLLPGDAGREFGPHAERVLPGLRRTVAMVLPPLAAIGVLFQLRLPTASGAVNVNLADPVVIVGGIILAGVAMEHGRGLSLWRVPGLGAALALFSLVLGAGFLHGYFALGLIDWALYNRLVGWGILLAFLGTGALASVIGGAQTAATLCRWFVLGCAVIVMLEWLARAVGLPLGLVPLMPVRAEGMAGNPNAFAFQLTLALVALLAGYGKAPLRGLRAGNLVLASLLLYGIWLSASRAGMGAAAVVLVGYCLLPHGRVRPVLAALAGALLIGLAPGLIDISVRTVLSWFGDGAAETVWGYRSARGGYVVEWSMLQSDRVASVVGGLAMWRENPLFGAGLGAFISAEAARTGVPLVIHNSALWAAAEMGLLGLVALLLIPLVIVLGLRGRLGGRTSPRWALLALGVGLVTLLFCMVHDMLYQRAIWLLLGAALAVPRQLPALASADAAPLPEAKPRAPAD